MCTRAKHCDRLWDACDECIEEAYLAWRKAEDEREAKKIGVSSDVLSSSLPAQPEPTQHHNHHKDNHQWA